MDSNLPRKSVLIIDYMGFDSCAEVPYLFSQAGYDVVILCDNKSWLASGSFFETKIVLESKIPDLFVRQVVHLVQKSDYDHICMVDDVAIRIMNEYVTDDNLARKILPITKLEHRKFLGSKIAFSKFCKEHHFLTPDFEVYENIRTIDFPVLLKVDHSQGGKGVFYCDDEITFNKFAQPGMVIQKYIKGELIGIEAYFHQGRLIASACSQVQKNVGGEFSISSERLYNRNVELEETIRKFGETLGAHGFASISFVQEYGTGKYFIFEFDSRTNAWLRLAQYVGVDFSQAIQVQETKQVAQGKVLRQFPRDFIRVVAKRDVRGIIGWFFNLDRQWRMVPWYDIKLVYSIITRAITSGIIKTWKHYFGSV